MERVITIAGKNYATKLPSHILAHVPFVVTVDSKQFHVRWHPEHQTFFVSDPQGPSPKLERSCRIRVDSIERKANGKRLARFRVSGGTEGSLIEAEQAFLSQARAVKSLLPREHIDTQHSPLTGKVAKLYLQPGQIVQKGEQIAIIEAMKMENKIFAEIDGQVSKIFISEQAKVSIGDELFSTSPPSE